MHTYTYVCIVIIATYMQHIAYASKETFDLRTFDYKMIASLMLMIPVYY
jgi:hypothetical protein